MGFYFPRLVSFFLFIIWGEGEVNGRVGVGGLTYFENAAVAGIMCSVGLQLFSQAIQIHHGHRLPFIFGFVGMGLLGVSFALTA
jgi:ZIP family zinc transporter